MCAIMNKLRAIKAAPRHRPVFDLRMPVLLKPGTLIAAVAPRETPMVFNSRLMQPLFTRMANLLQNALRANEQMQFRSHSANSKTIVTEFSQDFLCFSNLLMTNTTIPLCAFRIHE